QGEPLVSDFGVARLLEADGEAPAPGVLAGRPATTDTAPNVSLTRTGTEPGTPAYMAPEQFGGEAGQAADVWALGVIVYEMLTGRGPFIFKKRLGAEAMARFCVPPRPRPPPPPPD